MAVLATRPVVEKSFSGVNPAAVPPPAGAHTMGVDLSAGTYTVQIDGNALTGETTQTDDLYSSFTTSAGAYVLRNVELGRMAQVAGNGMPFGAEFLGWAIARLMQAGVSFDTIVKTAARSIGS